MLRFGIHTRDQFQRSRKSHRAPGSNVAYSLLDVGEDPNEENIQIFEEISFTLRTSNGTFRTSFRHRFLDLDELALKEMRERFGPNEEISIQDRAASHCLTSYEFASRIFQEFPNAQFEASDLLLELIGLQLNDGTCYITEPSGEPLQYIRPPFVISTQKHEPWRYPLNRWLGSRARRRFDRISLPADWMETPAGDRYTVRRISCVHPWAAAFARKDARFRIVNRSVFAASDKKCHVLRTMNILNKAYFSADQLKAGVQAAWDSVAMGGLWIVGRTYEDDLSNNATLWAHGRSGWKVQARLGSGSELDDVVLNWRPSETLK